MKRLSRNSVTGLAERTICAGLVACCLTGGCVGPMRTAAPRPQHDTPFATLFEDDDKLLSDEQLEQILNARVHVPDRARIAILEFDQPRQRDQHWGSPQQLQLNHDGVQALIGELESCTQIESATLLPQMLAPDTRNVPRLRLVSARFQADALLLYQHRMRTYHKSRLLGGDHIKAACVVQAVVLDIRSGLIVFSTNVSQDFTVQRTRDDFSSAETLSRARASALAEALKQVGTQLVDSLPSSATDT